MEKFDKFIPQNVAPDNAQSIKIYNPFNKQVGIISLGKLSQPNKGQRLYSFGALSDVHIGENTSTTDFQSALEYFNNTVDFVCISGDLVHGQTKELAEEQIPKYIECTAKSTIPIYACAGNHDGAYVSDLINRVEEYTGHPLWYTVEQENDVFIFVGCRSSSLGNLFTDWGGGTEELQWLHKQLDDNRNKRCFLFEHVFPEEQDACGNALGIYTYQIWGGQEAEIFENLLRHYHNVIFFHGHSHLKFNMQELDKTANYDKVFGCHSVHVPSLSVPRTTASLVNPSIVGVYADSEGYVIDVYESGIHLKGRDFIKNEFLPIASYWLDTTIQAVESKSYDYFVPTT